MLIHNAAVTGSLTLNGIDIGDITGSESSIASLNQATASLSSSIAILSGSFLTTSASYSSASGSLSTRVTTIEGKYATTGSNFFNGSQTVTGSLTVTNQIVAQTLNIQQVTSSTVYSSGSNVFGNSLSNTQQLTGSVSITGSLSINGTSAVVGTGTTNYIPKFTNGSAIGDSIINESSSTITINGTKRLFLRTNQSGIGGLLAGSALAVEGNFSIYSDSGVAGETLGIYYWNGSIYKSSLQVANVSSGNSNLILMKDGGNILVNSTSDNGNRLQVTGNGYFSGNVGINTTTLGERLNVNGGLGFQSSGTQNWHIYSNASNNLLFTRSGIADRMTLSSDGNLGLGVVPSAWASDWNVFQIGSISSLSQYNNNNSLLLSNNYYNSTIAGVGAKYIANGTAGVYQISGNNHYWYNAPSGTAGNAITLTQAMTLDASGNLLVGTTSNADSAKAYIYKNGGSSDFATNTTLFLQATNESTTANLIRFNGAIAKGLVFGRAINADNFIWGFTNSTTPVMTLTSGGDLLVGATTSAAGKLIVKDSSTSNHIWLIGRTSDGSSSLSFRNASDSSYAARIEASPTNGLFIETNGTERARITSGGNILVGTTTDNGNRLQVTGNGYFSGNVGVGTSSPSVALDVVGAGKFASTSYSNIIVDGTNATGWGNNIAFRSQGTDFGYIGSVGSLLGSTTKDMTIWATSGNAIRFYTNGNNLRATLDASGNLGLGVVPSAWDAAFKVFQIGLTSLYTESSVASKFGNNVYYSSGNKYYQGGEASQYVQQFGTHIWQTAPSGTAGSAITLTQAMTLDASGNLGIGTTTPIVRLHAEGTNSNIAVVNVIGTAPNYIFDVRDDGVSQFRVFPNGNIGIGTTTDSGYKLDVNGTGRIYGANQDAIQTVFTLGGKNASAQAKELYFRLTAGGTPAWTLQTAAVGTDTNFNIFPNGTSGLSIAYAGAATFSSSVTAKSTIAVSNNGAEAPILSATSTFADGYRATLRLNNTHTGGKQWDIYSTNNSDGGYSGGKLVFVNATDGVTALTMVSGGSVGIGTTSPAVALQVDASGGGIIRATRLGAGSAYIQLEADGTNGTLASSAALLMNAGGSERMRITSAGNVGIGTTSANVRLRVVGGSSTFQFALKLAKSDYADSGGHTTLIGLGCEDASWSRSAIGHTRTTSYDAGYLGFYVSNNNGDSNELVASDLRMMINRDGNVGIGTTSPGSILETYAGTPIISINGTTLGGSRGIEFKHSGENLGHVKFNASSGELGISVGKAAFGSFITFTSDTAERMRIASTGNVGIGTTSPGEKLEVNGNILATNFNSANAVVNTADTYTGTAKITNIITLSQAEYDAIGSPSSSYLYVII